MTRNGVPMLADFGISRALLYTESILKTTDHHAVKGTSNWLAPEKVRCFWPNNKDEMILDAKSDMWAFGMVIYVSS